LYKVFSTNARLYINCNDKNANKWQTHLKKFGRYKNFMKVVSIRRYIMPRCCLQKIYIYK
jgi:hypothetical protein